MTVKKDNKCIMESRFVENEGKMKGNYELTLLKMEQIEKTLERLEKTLTTFIESCSETYVSKVEYIWTKEEIKALKEMVKWFAITFIWGAFFTTIKLFWDKLSDLIMK